MDLKKLLDNILALGSNISIKDGRDIYKNKLVSNLSSKKIDDIYHIYSKVEEEKCTINSCHIKYNLKNEKVVGASCTCNTYKEFSKYKHNYICKHIVASIFYFYIVAKNRVKKIKKEKIIANNKGSKVDTTKKLLNLNLDIKKNDSKDFDIQIKIGENFTYLIPKLDEFLKCKEVKGHLRINGEFLYNSNLMEFTKDDEKFLNYININLKKGKSFKVISGKILRVDEYYIKDILKLINNKKVKLNYEYINYESYVINGDLPLTFTLKKYKEKIILTTKKKLPIPLNEDFNVFLNERNIYLPSETQINNYKTIYNKLKESGKIEYYENDASMNSLFELLGNISKDVFLGDGIKNICRKYYKIDIIFKNENNQIKCIVTINYFGKIINILDKNIEYFLRDSYYEDEVAMRLERYRFIRKEKEFIFIGDDDEKYKFLSEGIEFFRSFSNLEFLKSFDEINLISSNNIQGIFEEKGDKLNFKYNIDGVEYSEYINILKNLNEGKDFYKTEKGRLIDLKDLGVCSFFNIIDNLIYKEALYDGNLDIDKNRAVFIKDNIKNNNLNFVRGIEVLNNISKNLEKRDEVKKVNIDGLKATLRNYQIIGLNYLLTLSEMNFGGILADEMGLGKTIQVIAFLLCNRDKKSLVVTPTSLIYNWKDEFEKFAPSLKVGVVHGSKRIRESVLKCKDKYDILLTTYGTIKNDIDFYQSEFFDFCIIDEAQNIKNPKAKNTKIIKDINAKVKFALTGTPIENSLIELWSIFDFIMPGYLFDEKIFKNKFINKDEKEIKELKMLINPFILRRLKKDVITELPKKIEKKYYVSMTKEQKLAYQNYMTEVKLKLKTGEEDNITILSYLTRLRQICQDPILVNKDYIGDSGKIKFALEIIQEVIERNDKLLVFSQFTSVLKKIEIELNERKINNKYLDGSTSAKERIRLVREFNEDKNLKVFLISLKAGGTGLNLTSAKYVLHMDPWWNPAIEDQATDRAHRIGQENIVEVIKLVAKDTIEEKIVKLQEDKKEIINSVMDDDNLNINNISKLTNEEILELFK